MAAPTAVPAVSDEWLAARFQQGDAAAFESLVERYQAPLYHFACRLLVSTAEADDAVQDALIQVYRALLRAHLDGPVRPWIYRIARNRCLDVLKRRRIVPLASLDADEGDAGAALSASEPLPDELAERADLQRLLTAAIAELPLLYREVVALRYTGDLSLGEIATILNIPENTAKFRFHRAKDRLRQSLRALAPS